jgi:uncharacterized protein
MTIALEQHGQGVIVPVRVRAGARLTGIVGQHDGALRIDVSAAPEKGKANRAVIDVLADAFSLAKSSVELISGPTNAQKRFLLSGIDLAGAQQLLTAALAKSK